MESEKTILLSNSIDNSYTGDSINSESITLPFRISNVILLSPGKWNGLDFTAEDISTGFKLTDWSDKKNYELIKDHDDEPLSVNGFVGYTTGIHLSQENEMDNNGREIPANSLVGNLELWDKEMVVKLGFAKAKFGISAKLKGYELSGRFFIQKYNNFSVVDNPACKMSYVNLADNTCPECGENPCSCNKEELACKKKKMEEDEKKEEIKEEPKEEKLEEISQSNLLKGGLIEEQNMENIQNDMNAMPAIEAKAVEVKSEAILEEVAKVDANAELVKGLSAQIATLSETIKVLSERVEKVEKLSESTSKLSEKKVDAPMLKMGRPLSIVELAQAKDNRHSKGVLAMAQHMLSLQSK